MSINRILTIALLVSLFFLTSCSTSPDVLPTVNLFHEKITSTPEPVDTPTVIFQAPASSTPAFSTELQIYLDDALDLIQKESIYSNTVDWENLRAQVNEFAKGAQSIPELYPAIRMALSMTGDRHGYLLPPLEAQNYFDEPSPETLPDIHQELLEGRLGLVVVPTFASGNQVSVQQFASRFQDAIRSLDAQHPCGWIVDLRYNEGGNGFAMLTGVSPLLGDAVYGYHTYANGEISEWRWQDGKMLLGETVLVELKLPYQILQPDQPVAVLTNEITTSAGEMVAIAFRGWPNTRSFGQKTLGRTTAPEGFMLSDGAILGISVAYFTDHHGNVYQGKIIPDKTILEHDNPIFRDRSVPQPAIDWLLSQPACSDFRGSPN